MLKLIVQVNVTIEDNKEFNSQAIKELNKK